MELMLLLHFRPLYSFLKKNLSKVLTVINEYLVNSKLKRI